ncbi:DUF3828 domain-containing protein [Mangrovibacter phragmitis]|uniref:DUF3828 domain-containing protein n=1 Tax=Mangrovibacter phragmitis TaxID=1691903 RepID=UPI00336A3D99
MRLILSFLLAVYIPFASANASLDAQKSVTEFYKFYLAEYSKPTTDDVLHSPKMKQWVTKKLLDRLDAISNMSEEEYLEADYFTYTQDYSEEWASRLRTEPAVTDGDSERVDVWIGIQDNKSLHLQVWTHNEDGRWKIWRVIDAGNHQEQKLY